MTPTIPFAQSDTTISLLPQMINRHGLIAGATGTGKTVTLQTLVEQLSKAAIPVFVADVKGDLSGLSIAGGGNPKIEDRAKSLNIPLSYQGFPVTFWDVLGQDGHPIRASVSDMGPLLIGRLLDLNETQLGVLYSAFEIADDTGLLLLDLKDLRSLLTYLGDNASTFSTQYGNISKATIGTIQRGLSMMEQQGGDTFFGEPTINIFDFIRTGEDGRGMINLLSAHKLFTHPTTYATFLLWLLSELFEQLPEVGDLPKPKLVFFFDEAHVLFDHAPKALIEKIEQVVRLIRSKGVGIFFITQNPIDIPEQIAGQLGNRIQHALRAYTDRDLKAVKASASTFRNNPKLDTATVITQLEVGEALVSILDEKGAPSIVSRAYIIPPSSHIGIIEDTQKQSQIRESLLFGKYEQTVDRESAYEQLKKKAETLLSQSTPTSASLPEKTAKSPGRPKDSLIESVTKSAMRAAATQFTRTITNQIARQILRGVLGSISRGK